MEECRQIFSAPAHAGSAYPISRYLSNQYFSGIQVGIDRLRMGSFTIFVPTCLMK
jgi:hypothetical protein